MAQPGGPFPFELTVAAQPHDQATQLVGFSLGHEDLLNPSPTSLTLNFSGPIDLSNLFVPDRQETALEVVDSSGQVWPVTAEEYQPSNAQLTLIFDEPLPAGQYSLIVPSSGGLTDLAGEPVVAPGEPAGVLANWTVSRQQADAIPTTWESSGPQRPAWSGQPPMVLSPEATTLAPGQAVTYRWVVIVPGYYKLQTQVTEARSRS